MTDRRAKKACTECRQQKARCDAHNFEDGICSRCRKMHLECLMSDSFEREHKRRKLSEVERENIRLRQQLETTAKALTPNSSSQARTPARPQSSISSPVQEGLAGVDITGYGGQGTMRRDLDGTVFDTEAIDDLFEIFFRDFSPFLPILDSTMSPNIYFGSSPFLFWAIIAVGSRSHPKRPLPLIDLRPRVLDLAFSALYAEPSVQSIQALLILLTWPFPKTHHHADITSQLTGATLHMAMHMGLHIPISSHEYSRVKLQLTPAEIEKRAELWAQIIVVYQRVCLAKGMPANTVRDLTLDPEQRIALLDKIPGDSKCQFQIQSILTRCGNEAAKIGLRNMTDDRDRALDIILRVHEREIDNVSTPKSIQSRLYLLVGRITIQALHFFRPPTSLASEDLLLAKLTTNACEWIETCHQELSDHRIASSARPFYFLYSMLVCSCVLLRLTKTPMFANKILDLERANVAKMKAIEIFRSMILLENDTASRAVTIMQQLATSKRAFIRQNPDTGEREPVPLRIRSRIAMCHVLDAWAWWREEFGGPGVPSSGVYPPPLQKASGAASNSANGAMKSPTRLLQGTAVANGDAHPTPPSMTSPAYLGTPTMYQPTGAPATQNVNYNNVESFAQAQLDPNFGNLIGDDMFSELWTYWPDSHNWTTGLT